MLTAALTALVLAAPPAPAPPPTPDFLRGPRVLDGDKPSLVAHTMTGKMEILRGRPEIAAVDLVNVPIEAKDRVAALETERTRAIAAALFEHIDLVTRIVDENARGEGERASDLIDTLRDRIEPDRDRDVLFDDVVAIIGDQHAPELRRMVDEYWNALVDRRLINAGADPDTAPQRRRDRVKANQERALFHRELRTAYDQSLRTTQQALEGIFAAIEPTEDQRDAIRATVLEDFKRTGIDRTPADRRETLRRIYDLLDDGRKGKLFDYLTTVVVPDA